MVSLSRLEALFPDVLSDALSNFSFLRQRKRNLVLVNKDSYQRETITKWPIYDMWKCISHIVLIYTLHFLVLICYDNIKNYYRAFHLQGPCNWKSKWQPQREMNKYSHKYVLG